jgi:hypothetical protein
MKPQSAYVVADLSCFPVTGSMLATHIWTDPKSLAARSLLVQELLFYSHNKMVIDHESIKKEKYC